jgi:hypothetical protein
MHIDYQQLSKSITPYHSRPSYHLPWLVGGYSCPARVEVIEDKKALSVMFTTLKVFNILKRQYVPEVEAVITNNGAEFSSGPATKNKGKLPLSACCRKLPANTVTPSLTTHKLTGKQRSSKKPLMDKK